jgi:CubicO group peptidase (beta-lactamase class C family)
MRRSTAFSFVLVFGVALATSTLAGDRVPGDRWMHYADPQDAGFDVARLEAARDTWAGLPSSAFIVVADGAVVAAWGDVDRRFMCHSVRKSFLSALYGIYWDRGEMELNKTLADLGIDDEPDPLLETEKRARILDLLKARSGVFHPAAYAGRTDSQPRGSQGPGRYFAYNNWDFNTLATILEQETGNRVFESFDVHFAQPLGMEDWRVSDGYYHYERDKSKYPAYPFRLSARDAARFGLLFTREGMWGDTRILSQHWVRRSSALYSIDDDVSGYGFMWWVYREPRFTRHGMYSALGVGNQMIAALPNSDLVVVNRANTYEGEGTPSAALLDLVEQVLEARTGTPVAEPKLVPLDPGPPDPRITAVPNDRLAELVGEWDFPPAPLGLPAQTTVKITAAEGHVVGFAPVSGTFKLYLQPDGSLHEEDSHERYVLLRDDSGTFAGIADANAIVTGALAAAADGNSQRAEELLAIVEGEEGVRVAVGQAVVDLVGGEPQVAERAVRELAERTSPGDVEAAVNRCGYGFLQSDKADLALQVFELNTRVFPEAFNTWDSLGEAHMILGHKEDAIRCYERSLDLNEDNSNATAMISRIRESVTARD